MSGNSKVGKSVAGKSVVGKSVAGKAVGPHVPEPLPFVTPVFAGSNPANLPFPEWSDQDINSEKWDLPKGKDKAKQKTPTTPKKTQSTTPVDFPAVNNSEEPLQFVDPHLVHLPHSLPVHEWKRPSEVFPGTNFIMYKESSEYPDLISGSKHLLHSDFMRSFISAIGILEYLGNTRPSPIEFTSPTFFPNTGNEPWRPWYHIYSLCKAGKGQKHNPQVNTLGKYVVRLFWMGCWRKITIDDLLPIDLTNHVVLPSLDQPQLDKPPATPSVKVSSTKSAVASTPTKGKPGNKKEAKSSKGSSVLPLKKEIEMWPFLLCKALLKLASLTWTEFNEMLDFDIIHCLTGWFVQKIEVTGVDLLDLWDMCSGYSDHYTWPDPIQKRPGTGSSKGKSDKGSKASSSKTSKASKVPNFLDGADSKNIPYHLVATFTDLRTVDEEKVPDISPCWSHHFLIDQTRDIPLIKPDPLPDLARWKRFRWLAWAIREGLRPAPELTPIKCVKMVSVFKKCAEHVVYKPPSKEAIDIKKSVAVIEELALEMGDSKKKVAKDKGNKDVPAKKEKSSKSSKSGSAKGKIALPLPPDPSIWGDFNNLGSSISCLYIYFKSSKFATSIRITDISQATVGKETKGKVDKGKKGGKTETTSASQLVMWNNELKLSRNEPFYIFMDSIDSKLVVINLAQVGNSDVFLKDEFCKTILKEVIPLQKAKRNQESYNLLETLPIEKTSSESLLELNDGLHVPFTYAVIENYDWTSLKVNDMAAFLNTYGTKTILIDVKPGRFVMRVWIKSDTSYNIQFMSDTSVVAGSLEVVLENMCHEPERLLKMCHDISSTYGQLVQKFGTPHFVAGLTSFCSSYSPNFKLPKLQLQNVHNAFVQALLKTSKENCSPDELKHRIFALKVLFMNPSIKLKNAEEKCTEITDLNERDNSSLISEDLELAKKSERAATILQAFFKKLYVRKLKTLHAQSHKDHLKIFDILKKIYLDIFGIQKRMLMCPSLIRNFIMLDPNMCNLKTRYSLYNDLNSTIHLQHLTGNLVTFRNTWLPIARYVFYCNSPNAVLVKISLFCECPKYMVRVFDNDTNQEIKRFTNNVEVHNYDNNALGYTVLCYGWSETEGYMAWKLDFITLKQSTVSLVVIPAVSINNYVLKHNYTPNVNHVICRCLIKINRDTLATFRLSTGHENAKLYFRCLNEVGQMFAEIYGTENVILPAVMLKYVETIEEIAESIVSSNKSILSKEKKLKGKARSTSLVRTPTNASLKKKERSLDRMSVDRHSSKCSTLSTVSLKKRKVDSITSHDTSKYKDTVYILEGFVLDDSWPLTKAEWNVVEKIQASRLLQPPVTAEKDTHGSFLKFKEMFSLRRSTELSNKSIDKKRKSLEVKPLSDPIWILEAISNTEDNLMVTVDTRREEEIKDIKRKWYENDTERYAKSKALREAYLESHYIKNDAFLNDDRTSDSRRSSTVLEYTEKPKMSLVDNGQLLFSHTMLPDLIEVDEDVDDVAKSESVDLFDGKRLSIIIEEEENKRTLKKPVSLTKMLPPLILENYSQGVIETKQRELQYPQKEWIIEKEMYHYVKSAEDEEYLKLQREQAISDFEMDQMLYEEDMLKYLADQVGRHKLLDVFYKGCREDSKEIMRKAYVMRQKVIDLIIDAVSPNETPATVTKKRSKKK